MPRRGFTLVELLVVVAVISLLVGILLPALSRAKAAGDAAVCLSNLRQQFLACRAYADENAGFSPAIGKPYAAIPNWALVVQEATQKNATGADLYSESSVLVCPAVRASLGRAMTRTYAMNATGHAGAPVSSGVPADPDNYDTIPAGAHPGDPAVYAAIRMDRVVRPVEACLLVDSAPLPVGVGQPPPTRTASTLDFRNPDHVSQRLAWVHTGKSSFQAAFLDGSARGCLAVPETWKSALP